MRTFEDYSASFITTCDPGSLDFCLKDSEYCIYHGTAPLRTPGGRIFSHPLESVIRLLLTDLQVSGDVGYDALSSPVLYSFCKDVIQEGSDPFLRLWAEQLKVDPFVRIKTSGNAAFRPFSPDDPLFHFAFITLTGLTGVVSSYAGRAMSEISLDESDSHPFISLLKQGYERLPADHKVAVQALSGIHHSGIVLPLILVAGEISAVEYAQGLLALNMQPRENFSGILTGVARVQSYIELIRQKSGQDKQTTLLIREGEGDAIEFKSTLRWDIRAGKSNPAIERSCLKTIAAFLNSTGGTLLIGVRDDGSIEGIASDKFANEDKFLLHLWTLIRNCLGRDFSPYIRTRLEKRDEQTVCIVDCMPSSRPVFLRQPGYDEEMYIRVGPSSNALDISEALRYINDHFGGRYSIS